MGFEEKLRGPMRRLSNRSPASSDCRAMSDSGNRLGPAISRPMPDVPVMTGWSKRPSSGVRPSWRSGIRSMTRQRPYCTGSCVGPVCEAWRAFPSGALLSWDPPVALARPLLSVSRQAIRESLGALGQSYREDVSNADLAPTRARIRHDLLPRLAREYNPRIVEALVRLGRLAGDSERAMDRRLREMAHSVTWSASGQQVEMRRDWLLELPVFLRAEVLRRVWREAGWPEAGMSARRWRRLAMLAQPADQPPGDRCGRGADDDRRIGMPPQPVRAPTHQLDRLA